MTFYLTYADPSQLSHTFSVISLPQWCHWFLIPFRFLGHLLLSLSIISYLLSDLTASVVPLVPYTLSFLRSLTVKPLNYLIPSQ